MRLFLPPFFLGLLFIACSCKSGYRYTYAIKDFPKALQPYLADLVERGYVSYRGLPESVTDYELRQLGMSEHPQLRVVAFREMFHRKSFDQIELLMGHLDDTAWVYIERGEFGIHEMVVSDELIDNARWTSEESKRETVVAVLSRHNYLSAAYDILQFIEPDPQLYPYIRQMAGRPRRVNDEGSESGFRERESALYGLAKFGKPEDKELIRQTLLAHTFELSDVSLRLIRNSPDTAWQRVLEKYYRQRFYQFSGNRRGGFSGFPVDKAEPEDFIGAVVAQENDSSAALLNRMLIDLPKAANLPDHFTISNYLILQIWRHDVPVYAAIRERVRKKAELMVKEEKALEVNSYYKTDVKVAEDSATVKQRPDLRWLEWRADW